MAKSEKSMTLEQFKTELQTDATKRNAEQEKTIKRLIAENKRLETENQAIQKRFWKCYSSVNIGIPCLFCRAKSICRSVIRNNIL